MPKNAKPASARRAALLFGDLWEFDPAPETADPKIKARYDLFIDGAFVRPRSGKYFDSINPANERKLAEIALAGAADVNAAYAAAQRAFGPWSALPGRERGKYLFRIARLLQDRAREFAVAETIDGGKPIKESRDFDVPMAAAHFFYHAGWADKLEYVAPGRSRRPARRRRPGDPLEFPAPHARVEARARARDGQLRRAQARRDDLDHRAEAGRDPPGRGPAAAASSTSSPAPARPARAVMGHPGAAKVAFTGSTEVGKAIMRQLAGTDKKMTMELGGKAANIVFDDAPIDQAVEGIVNGIFFNQGHVCCAGSRLLVHEPVADRVIAKLKNRIRVLRVGDPLDKNTDLGAINSAAQLAKIRRAGRRGREGGRGDVPAAVPAPDEGLLFPARRSSPSVTQSHRIAREEIFGPVLCILTFRTVDEAIEKANNTPYGLSAGVWTDKGSRILQMSTELKAGVVWANTFNKFDPSSPFGGYKESGFGREGGRQGLLDYCK